MYLDSLVSFLKFSLLGVLLKYNKRKLKMKLTCFAADTLKYAAWLCTCCGSNFSLV